MQHSRTHLRSRPIGMGYLRAFEAVARHLNFRVAAEEMALTQSAVSRQIQSLEDEVGVPLLLRHTRSVELTQAGAQLLAAIDQAVPRLDAAVRQIRRQAGRRSVQLTTFASFASLWLIPRLEEFQSQHPDIDIRIDASDAMVDLELSDLDLALRYGPPQSMPAGAVRLFGEELTPVASPWLIKGKSAPTKPADLAVYPLIEAGDGHRSHLEWLTWQRYFDLHGSAGLVPKRWLTFTYAYQMIQAASAGQGVVLARMPLVAEQLASGDLKELLPRHRAASPMAYWLIRSPLSRTRPEIEAFCAWLLQQAAHTRQVIGDRADPDTLTGSLDD